MTCAYPRLRFAAVLVLALLMQSETTRAAVDAEPPAPASMRAFTVVPNDQPSVGYKRQPSRVNGRILVKSQAMSAEIQRGFYRGVAMIVGSTLALIILGYRIYGRRQGRAAT